MQSEWPSGSLCADCDPAFADISNAYQLMSVLPSRTLHEAASYRRLQACRGGRYTRWRATHHLVAYRPRIFFENQY